MRHVFKKTVLTISKYFSILSLLFIRNLKTNIDLKNQELITAEYKAGIL